MKVTSLPLNFIKQKLMKNPLQFGNPNYMPAQARVVTPKNLPDNGDIKPNPNYGRTIYAVSERYDLTVTVDDALKAAVFIVLEKHRAINTTNFRLYTHAKNMSVDICNRLSISSDPSTKITIEECNLIQEKLVNFLDYNYSVLS